LEKLRTHDFQLFPQLLERHYSSHACHLIIKELLEASVIEESDLEFISKEISWKKGLNYKTFTGEKEKISSQSFKIEV